MGYLPVGVFRATSSLLDWVPKWNPAVVKTLHSVASRSHTSEISYHESIGGWLSHNEATALFLLATIAPRGATIVEIGSWKGKSTYCLASGASKDGRVIAIDPFDASGEPGSEKVYGEQKGDAPLLDQFVANMRRGAVWDKVQPLKGYSEDFVGRISAIDVLFIDGDHSIEGCKFDFDNYAPHVRDGGYIALHDYDPSRPELGPTWVIENEIKPNPRFSFVGQFDRIWIARKVSA